MNPEQMQKQYEEQMQIQQQVNQVESIAKPFMSKEAISRYGNVKAVHPELAIQTIAFIAQAVNSKQITKILSDEDFKSMLAHFKSPQKEFKFLRK